MTLTKAQNLKGNKFNLVDTIIFDEFIIEDGVHHYLKGEVNSFLGLCETLARTRNFRCFMLANSVTTTNPYFLEFNLSLPYNNDIKTFKDGTILVQYMKNEEYRKMKKQTRFGKMVEGTSYSRYAIDNEFIQDNKTFIEHKSPHAKFSFAFIYNNFTFGVWTDINAGKMFVSLNYDKSSPYIFSTTLDNHRPNTMLLKSAKNYSCWKRFIENYKLGNVYFENQKIKNICYELIKIILT